LTKLLLLVVVTVVILGKLVETVVQVAVLVAQTLLMVGLTAVFLAP
jgi:hypothetical protein